MEPLARFLVRADLVPKEESKAFGGTAEEQLLPPFLPLLLSSGKSMTQWWYKPFSKRYVRITGIPFQQYCWVGLKMSTLIITASQGITNKMHLS